MRPTPSAQTASICGSCLGSSEPESFAMLLVCQSIWPHRCTTRKTTRSSLPGRRPRSETSDRFGSDASKYLTPREVVRGPRGALAVGFCSAYRFSPWERGLCAAKDRLHYARGKIELDPSPMSALGQKRTYALQQAMSALHPD